MISFQAAAITLLCGSNVIRAGSKAGRGEEIHLGARCKRAERMWASRFARWTAKDDGIHGRMSRFIAASTMKVPVLIELFHQVSKESCSSMTRWSLRTNFAALWTVPRNNLIPPTIPRPNFTNSKDETRTLAQLAELMIHQQQLRHKPFGGRLGVEEIRAEVHALGADGMNVCAESRTAKAFEKGMNNTTTARGLAFLMTGDCRGQSRDAESSQQMAAILGRQNSTKPSGGAAAGIRVAHKTGDITKVTNDAAIVYAKRPFVLVVLVRDCRGKSGLRPDGLDLRMTCMRRPIDRGAFYAEKEQPQRKYIIQAYGCWCLVVMGTPNARRLRMKTWTKNLVRGGLGRRTCRRGCCGYFWIERRSRSAG